MTTITRIISRALILAMTRIVTIGGEQMPVLIRGRRLRAWVSAALVAVSLTRVVGGSVGVWQWVAVYDVQGNAAGWAAAPDGSRVYVAGETALTNNVDIAVLGLDHTGGVAWVDVRGSVGADSATGIGLDSSGYVYVSGVCAAGFDAQGAVGSGDYVLVSYDTLGGWRWTRIYGTPAYDAALGMSVGGDGIVYVVGATEDRFGSSPRGGASDLFLAAHATDGAQLWAVSRGSATDDWATAVIQAGGFVYVGGVTLGSLDGGPTYGGMDGFVMCFRTNGTWQWTRQFGTNENDVLSRLWLGDDGRLYAVGGTYGEVAGAGRGRDMFVVRITTNGVVEYFRAIGTTSDDAGLAVQAVGGVLHVAGWTYGTFTGATSSGGADFVMVQCTTGAVVQSADQAGTGGDDIGVGAGAYFAATVFAGVTPASTPGSFRVVAGSYVIPEAGWAGVLLVVALLAGMRWRGRMAHGVFVLALLAVWCEGVVHAAAIEEYTSVR
ncbi:MAG: hypothetical protein N2595_11050, partial [bacterium]|nr:hypothetical protein [bacterium]